MTPIRTKPPIEALPWVLVGLAAINRGQWLIDEPHPNLSDSIARIWSVAFLVTGTVVLLRVAWSMIPGHAPMRPWGVLLAIVCWGSYGTAMLFDIGWRVRSTAVDMLLICILLGWAASRNGKAG